MATCSEGKVDPTFQYLIIGGAPKSATTSLFRYLADHPHVCPSSQKETYFFAREFDFEKTCRLPKTTAGFENFFPHCHDSGKVRLEATPYTLYARGSVRRIQAILDNPGFLFVLRDPVDRLFSNYWMELNRGRPFVRNKSFRQFVDQQIKSRNALPNALKVGRYADYLPSFFKAFGTSKVTIFFFEEFRKRPVANLKTLCNRIGIDGDFYTTYRFQVHNRSIVPKARWLTVLQMKAERVVRFAGPRLVFYPRVERVFRLAVRRGKTFSNSVNSRNHTVKKAIPDDVRRRLEEYYRPSCEALSALLNRPLPWKWTSTAESG